MGKAVRPGSRFAGVTSHYGLLRTIEQLPAVALWLAMVQREVGQRLVAAPGSAAIVATDRVLK